MEFMELTLPKRSEESNDCMILDPSNAALRNEATVFGCSETGRKGFFVDICQGIDTFLSLSNG